MTDLERLRRLAGDGSEGWSPRHEGAFVERVLSRTTRASTAPEAPSPPIHPGWRGDVLLVLRFVGAQLRESRALRVAAAASLLLHVAAVPALAWWLLEEEPQPSARLVFEPPLEWPVEEAVEPPRPIQAPSFDDGWPAEPDPTARPEAENAVRRARYVLAHWPVGEGGAAASDLRAAGELRWLGLRLLVDPDAWGGALEAGDWRSARSDLERALVADLLLDGYVLGKPLPGDWRSWLGALDVGDGRSGAAPSTPEWLRWSLARAHSYGLLGVPVPDRNGRSHAPGGSPEGHPFPQDWLEAAAELVRAPVRAPSSSGGDAAPEPLRGELEQALRALRKRSADRP